MQIDYGLSINILVAAAVVVFVVEAVVKHNDLRRAIVMVVSVATIVAIFRWS